MSLKEFLSKYASMAVVKCRLFLIVSKRCWYVRQTIHDDDVDKKSGRKEGSEERGAKRAIESVQISI